MKRGARFVFLACIPYLLYLGASIQNDENDWINVGAKTTKGKISMKMFAACGLNTWLLMPLKARLVPGRGLLSLKEEDLSEHQIRGSQVQITILSGNLLLDSMHGKVKCHVIGCSKLDKLTHFVNCEKNKHIGELKSEIRELLDEQHVLKSI